MAESLTAREQEVLSLVGQEWTNRQIAGELVLAHGTVRWYLRQIYSKLGVADRGEAAVRARVLGLAAEPASPRASDNNVPTPATPFVGRQVELQALNALLLEPHVCAFLQQRESGWMGDQQRQLLREIHREAGSGGPPH